MKVSSVTASSTPVFEEGSPEDASQQKLEEAKAEAASAASKPAVSLSISDKAQKNLENLAMLNDLYKT